VNGWKSSSLTFEMDAVHRSYWYAFMSIIRTSFNVSGTFLALNPILIRSIFYVFYILSNLLSLTDFILYYSNLRMIFEKCPTCDAFAFIQLNNSFKCENGHVFNRIMEEKTSDDEIWEHMPEWTRKLRDASRF